MADLAPPTDLRQGGVQDVIGRRADKGGALGQALLDARDHLPGVALELGEVVFGEAAGVKSLDAERTDHLPTGRN